MASKKEGSTTHHATAKPPPVLLPVEVTVQWVLSDKSQKPLHDAKVEIKTDIAGGVRADSGNTDKSGKWTSRDLALPATITVTLDGYTADVRHTKVLPPSATATGPVAVTITMHQVTPKVKVTVWENCWVSPPGKWVQVPVIGAKVTIGGAKAQTDSDGVCKMDGTEGTSIIVDVEKPGYTRYSKAQDFDQVESKPHIDVVLTNEWGRVCKGSDVTVGGTPFVDWYNAEFVPKAGPGFPVGALDKGRFTAVMDTLVDGAEIGSWPYPLSLEEFVGVVLAMWNESMFASIGEGDTPTAKAKHPAYAYFFEKRGKKASYNQGENRSGAQRLKDGKILENAGLKATDSIYIELMAKWGSTTSFPGADKYPKPVPTPPGVKKPAPVSTKTYVPEAVFREFDFYKYRGHGLIQVTWHNYYLQDAFISALKRATGKSGGGTNAEFLDTVTVDEMETQIYTNMTVAAALLRGWLWTKKNAKNFRLANHLVSASGANDSRGFVNFPGGVGYEHYRERCNQLRNAMIKVAKDKAPVPLPASAVGPPAPPALVLGSLQPPGGTAAPPSTPPPSTWPS